MHPNARTGIEANRVRKHSRKSRRKMSESQRRRGAWPPSAGRPWTAEEDASLGTMPDSELVRRIDRTLAAIRCRRQDLGIRMPREDAFTPCQDALLRTLTDEEAAERTGRTVKVIVSRRKKLRSMRKRRPKRKPK